MRKLAFKTYKLSLLIVCLLCMISTKVVAAHSITESNNKSASVYAAKGVVWSLSSGQVKYTSSFYVGAGEEITIMVSPTPTSGRYYVGIQQPSGSERKIAKSGGSTTTYAIPSAGNYKVFIHNITSSKLDVTVQYMY